MIRPGSRASSAASPWVSGSPQGSIRITGPGLWGRIESTAANTGSGLSTIPGPPPKATSSTWRWRSWVKARRSCVSRASTPAAIPRPTTPRAKTGPKTSGKMLTTSKRRRGAGVIEWLDILDLQQPVGDHHPTRRQVHLLDRLFGGGHQVLDPVLVGHPDVVGGAPEHVRQPAQRPARLGQHLQPHQLVGIEAPGRERPRLRHLQVAAPVELGQGPAVDPGQLHDQAGALGPAPLHPSGLAGQLQGRPRLEAVGEVCQGFHLDSPLDSEWSGDQADPDHRGGVAMSTNTRRRSRREATRTSVRSASMLRPALPISRPTSSSAILTLIASVPAPRSKACTSTSSGFSATDFATNSTSAR